MYWVNVRRGYSSDEWQKAVAFFLSNARCTSLKNISSLCERGQLSGSVAHESSQDSLKVEEYQPFLRLTMLSNLVRATRCHSVINVINHN